MAKTQRTELKPVPNESWEAQEFKNQGPKAKFQPPKTPYMRDEEDSNLQATAVAI